MQLQLWAPLYAQREISQFVNLLKGYRHGLCFFFFVFFFFFFQYRTVSKLELWLLNTFVLRIKTVILFYFLQIITFENATVRNLSHKDSELLTAKYQFTY